MTPIPTRRFNRRFWRALEPLGGDDVGSDSMGVECGQKNIEQAHGARSVGTSGSGMMNHREGSAKVSDPKRFMNG